MVMTKQEERRGRSLFKKVEKLIQKDGCVKAAMSLGYRSPSFFLKWKEKQMVPKIALDRVESFFSKA